MDAQAYVWRTYDQEFPSCRMRIDRKWGVVELGSQQNFWKDFNQTISHQFGLKGINRVVPSQSYYNNVVWRAELSSSGKDF